MRFSIALAASSILFGSTVASGDDTPPAGVRRVADAVEAAAARHSVAIDRVVDDATRLAESGRWREERGRLIAEAIVEVHRARGESEAFDLLDRLHALSVDLREKDLLRELIFNKFSDDPRLAPHCLELAYAARSPDWPQALAWLDRAARESSGREVRGAAAYALGLACKGLAEVAWYAERRPTEAAPQQFLSNMMGGPEMLKALHDQGHDALMARADESLARVVVDYPEIRDAGGRPLGASAEAYLFELRNLTIGKVAPEIEGDDLDGRKLRLSDFRGRVAVVSFWGTWCGPCMALVPQERTLIDARDGGSLALFGVNSDPDLAKLRRVMLAEGITWPSWRNDGRVDGPISKRWNVRGWPTVYVLDKSGVIRWKRPDFPAGETLTEAVDSLLEHGPSGP